jgi:hypothetical protein
MEEFGRFLELLSYGSAATNGEGHFYFVGGMDLDGRTWVWGFTEHNPFGERLLRTKLNPYQIVVSDWAGSVYIAEGSDSCGIRLYNPTSNTEEIVAMTEKPINGGAGAWNRDSVWIFGGLKSAN